MKIMIESRDGRFKQVAFLDKETESGFYCHFDSVASVPFKFPWKLYTYKKLEEK